VTGWKRPDRDALPRLVQARKPNVFRFKDDGETPNNPRWPLVIYRTSVKLRSDFDPAAIFEDLFASNGWGDSWRNGVYPFLHFHTHRNEVLDIARGSVHVRFGGAKVKSSSAYESRRCGDPAGRNGPSGDRREERFARGRRLSREFRSIQRA
jgi:hypothetical protein